MDAGFHVIVTVADNHPVNRYFFKQVLCDGELKPLTKNPLNPNLELFVLIDPTHTVKNLYNNFQKSKGFCIPSIDNIGGYSPKFQHIVQLYEMESTRQPRLAHRLSLTCLRPSNIQRTSAKLAYSVFDESTANAMEYFSINGKANWIDTARFVKDMSTLLKIVNVRDPTVGIAKKDSYRQPITSINEEHFLLLSSYEKLFIAWRDKKTSGLTSETFTACILMCQTLSALANHLLNRGFHYVLLGKMSSDQLEHRFGRFRQMSGANYFITVKQLNVIYFVCGYIAKVISQKFRCESCLQVLSFDDNLPFAECSEHSDFFDIVNRGSLKRPSDALFVLCSHAYKIFGHIKQSEQFFSFLNHTSPSSLFFSVVSATLRDSEFSSHLFLICSQVHDLASPILRCFFNILAKNLVRNWRETSSESRKLTKLQSSR